VEKKNKDYLIPEFEKRLKKAEELKKQIDNPELVRFLSTQRELETKYNKIMGRKTLLYLAAKKAIEAGFKLIHRTDRDEIGYLASYSDSGHPQICYADKSGFTSPITTFAGCPFAELSPKKFMLKLIKSD
jgi:hypothetical protein